MRDSRAGKLLRNAEIVAYWAAGAPVLARLPAALGYRIACWRGDFLFRCQIAKRTEVIRNMRTVLGGDLDPAAAQQVARQWFRLSSCRVVDVMRVRRGVQSLQPLVEVRGREHLEAALAAGHGAILCCSHFGSYDSGVAVLHSSGFPVTVVGRRGYACSAGRPFIQRWFWGRVYTRPMWRHRQRPNIEPGPDRFKVAALAAGVLRANEVVTISIDAAPLDGDEARTIDVPFLGRQARLLPGVSTLAQLTGAPVLMAFLYRTADYRHQVWEISAPVPMDGDPATAFTRCTAVVSEAIMKNPAHWEWWAGTGALDRLGLFRDLDQPARPRASLCDRTSSAAAP